MNGDAVFTHLQVILRDGLTLEETVAAACGDVVIAIGDVELVRVAAGAVPLSGAPGANPGLPLRPPLRVPQGAALRVEAPAGTIYAVLGRPERGHYRYEPCETQEESDDP